MKIIFKKAPLFSPQLLVNDIFWGHSVLFSVCRGTYLLKMGTKNSLEEFFKRNSLGKPREDLLEFSIFLRFMDPIQVDHYAVHACCEIIYFDHMYSN